MDSQLLPNLFHYIQSTWPAVDRGLRQHNVFTVTPEDWRHLVQLGWSRHKAAAFTRLQCKDTAFIKKSFAGLFIHGRNHAITHGHAFCQRFAWQTYKSKFGDTAVYQQVPLQPFQAEEFLRSTVSCLFFRRYGREINLRTSSSPTAYLFFKQKKDFKGAGARPIISQFTLCMQNCSEPLPLFLMLFFALPVPDLLGSTLTAFFSSSQSSCSSPSKMRQPLYTIKILLDFSPLFLSFVY